MDSFFSFLFFNFILEEDIKPSSITNNRANFYKHVDFKLSNKPAPTQPNSQVIEENDQQDAEETSNNNDEVDEEDDYEEEADRSTGSGHCRLRRRDTPHHLKGARINNSSSNAQHQLDPSEMKEILERYSNPNYTNNVSTSVAGQALQTSSSIQQQNYLKQKLKPATAFIPENFKYDQLRKLIQLVIKINRQDGAGLGIRIAGGKGSNPYKEDDEGIFITRILPDSPAKNTGLKVGDKLFKVNQISLDNLTHQEAADALKEAVKSGSQLTLSVFQELDLNKVFVYLFI